MSELFGVDEIPEGNFTITFNIIDWYQRKYPGLTAKLKLLNKHVNHITCEDKIIIP